MPQGLPLSIVTSSAPPKIVQPANRTKDFSRLPPNPAKSKAERKSTHFFLPSVPESRTAVFVYWGEEISVCSKVKIMSEALVLFGGVASPVKHQPGPSVE